MSFREFLLFRDFSGKKLTIEENISQVKELLREYIEFGGFQEVDFVIRKGIKVTQLIQVTYASEKNTVRKREISGLIKAAKEFGCNDLLVITWECDDVELVGDKKIVYRSLWKWLLAA